MLVEVGLLRPDGTPAFGPGTPQPEMAAAEQPAAEPGKLWTPDSAEPGSGGKLWTPRIAASRFSGRREWKMPEGGGRLGGSSRCVWYIGLCWNRTRVSSVSEEWSL